MNEALQGPAGSGSGGKIDPPEELARYTGMRYDLDSLAAPVVFPLPDEPFVSCWRDWVEEARRGRGAFEVLRAHLPQLAFPIREGISTSEEYRAATRRGVDPARLPSATDVHLEQPEALELLVHPSPAGSIPILVTPVRSDFVTLVRALARRNEPTPVPGSRGAAMVSGFNNWARVGKLRRHWETQDPRRRTTATWPQELARISSRPELFRDRFVLLHTGPYSGVPASDLGLDSARWRDLSLAIRREHECAHYLTLRCFGVMRDHALDELVADYAGLVGATGRFRADWFLRFMGIDREGEVREDGRLHLYRGAPPLSDQGLRALASLLRVAAVNLERLDASWHGNDRSLAGRARRMVALASLRLEEIADDRLEDLVREGLEKLAAR